MVANKKVAKRGGNVAGNARIETEKELGRGVISCENHLQLENDDLPLLSEDQDRK